MLKKRVPPPGGNQDRPRVVNGVMKLKELQAPPDAAQVMSILNYAQTDSIKVVEQQWEQENQIYVLRCSASAREEPVWTFLVGSLTRMPTEKWRYPTGDVSLVRNLITSESTGAGLADLISSSKEMLAATPNFSQVSVSEGVPASPTRDLELSGTHHKLPSLDTPTILQGDLVIVQLPTLLQSIKMSKMTGRLELRNNDGGSDVYFDDGKPVHAEYCGSVGDIAIIELLSWQSGQFRFHPGERTVERTIKNRLDQLLMEGVTFADQSAFLEKQGLTLSSYLIRKRPDLRQREFESILQQGAPVSLNQAGNLYCQIDDTITLLDLLRIVPLPKTEWVPIMFNFLAQNIIVLSDQPARSKKTAPIAERGVDMSAAENAMRGAHRAETGILTYGAFLYFLQQEFARFEAGGPPFAIIVLEARVKRKGEDFDHISASAVKEMIQRVQGLIRPFEMICHFETFDFVVFLPLTELKTAALVAQRLVISLKTIPGRDWDSEYSFWAGVAGVPGDGKTVGTLLAAAQEAKSRAFETQTAVVMYRTLLS